MFVHRSRLRAVLGLVIVAIAIATSDAAQVGSQAKSARVLVVCPEPFRKAMVPWVEYRTAQGYSVQFSASQGTAEQIQAAIRREAEIEPVGAVLLVGDCPEFTKRAALPDGRTVPTHYVAARVIPRFGGEPQIATDNPYADLDGDDVPDVALGRLPVDSAEQLTRVIKKIIDFESKRDLGRWRRRIHVIAGLGGFGGMIDRVIESTTKRFLVDGIPASFETTMTQASWTSPYCPDPRAFAETVVERMNEGGLFWVYCGHGHPQGLDWLRVPGGRYPIFSGDHIRHVHCRHAGPIALFFSCYAGAIDSERDCLAERLVLRSDGPIAALAATRVTMPYGMATLGSALLDECFLERRATLGEMLLRAKRRAAQEAPVGDTRRQLLDAIGTLFGGNAESLAMERQEHLHLFQLLGDPLLRIRHPQDAVVEAQSSVAAGRLLPITIRSPVGGVATVELIVRRDRLTFPPVRRHTFDRRHDPLAEYQEVYRRANDPRLVRLDREVAAGEWQVSIAVPEDAVGACHVRCFVRGERDYAVGSADVHVEPASLVRVSTLPPGGRVRSGAK